ncbi:MAG: T9SS type A sorting domain-containing protein, partial [Bacteroidota bacterium]|nr:T9SS type A sorting domain-containing protein [Bacteroidota bacterium]
SGSYNQIFTNVGGCDSLHTLDITILPSIYSTNTYNICEGDSVVILNNVYNQDGSYYDTISALNGCDSILNTVVIVDGIIPPIISGPIFGIELDIDTFTVVNNQGSTYTWGVDIGNLISGQGSSSIDVEWISDGLATLWVVETNSSGCISDTVFYSLDISGVTGISNVSIQDLLVYPNPTKGMLTISFNVILKGDYELTIINIVGEQIFHDKLRSYSGIYSSKVDLSDYSKAIYFLEIDTGDGTIIKKITLQ